MGDLTRGVMDVERAPDGAGGAGNPTLVEVVRGSMVESRHSGAFAVADTSGTVVLHAGDIERPVYPRSAIKPLQALVLVETGAAEAYDLGDAEIALACASHNGERAHVETARAWLARIGCAPEDLECGPHMPYDDDSATELLRQGQRPSPLHNNCSGKHAGFLTVARHLGRPTAGYIKYEHPVQQHVLGVLEQMTGCDLGAAPRGIDGCGIPTLGIPLGHLAFAMARFADPADLPERRQAAVARIRRAVAATPFMVAGTGRFCTRVMEAAGEQALVKTGAEGVFCAALPGLGLGIAVKVDDGASRASQALVGRLLCHLKVLDDGARQALADLIEPAVTNRAGRRVGEIRVTCDALS